MLFKPTRAFKTILSLTPEILCEMGIKALILDVDNTLTTHNNPAPAYGVSEWIENTRKAGIKLMIVSNNHAQRVSGMADTLGLPFVAEGAKPLPAGYKKAAESLGVSKSELCAVGDQIFTDILGANIFGIKSVFVRPIELESGFFFKIKRFFEKPLRPTKFEDE